jgi:hypothetical protein
MSKSDADELKKYVKVGINLEGGSREWLWCTKIRGKKNLFTVCNVPFYASGISLEDVIEAVPVPAQALHLVPDFNGVPAHVCVSVVEHIRETVHVKYAVPETMEELKMRFSQFSTLCEAMNARVEGLHAGHAVVAVPWGKVAEMSPMILEHGRKAELNPEIL